MLVLSRKLSEQIVVTTPSGEQIVITVVTIDKGKIRLGLEADQSITIDRGEVAEEKGYYRRDKPRR